MYDKDHFGDVCRRNGIQLEPVYLEKMESYVLRMLEWNSKVNLISRADVRDVWRNHILHSVSLLTQFVPAGGGRYLDLGTGGGLPGLPLAILRPGASFLLCDSIGKKIRAVEEMRTALGLRNVETVAARAEELRDAPIRRSFHGIFARGVTDLTKLVAMASPLLAGGGEGVLIAWKGGDLAEELARARRRHPGAEIVQRPIRLAGEPYFEEQRKALVYVRLHG